MAIRTMTKKAEPKTTAAKPMTEKEAPAKTTAEPAKKAEPVKAAETKKPVETEKKEEPMKKEETVKKTTVKKAAAPRKTAVKKAEKKAAPANTEVYVQFLGKEVYAKDLVENIKKIWTDEMGKKEEDIQDLKVYIKPEDNGAYYVINGEAKGFLDL